MKYHSVITQSPTENKDKFAHTQERSPEIPRYMWKHDIAIIIFPVLFSWEILDFVLPNSNLKEVQFIGSLI